MCTYRVAGLTLAIVTLGSLAAALPTYAQGKLTLTASSGTTEFDTVALGAATPLAAPALFGNGTAVANGQVLLNAGNAFPTTGAFANVNTINHPLGIGGAGVTDAQAAGGAFGGGVATYKALGTNTGGGIIFSAPTTVNDPGPDGTASVLVADGVATLQNQTGKAFTENTALGIGLSGFVPAGAYVAAALTATITPPVGAAFSLAPVGFALDGPGNAKGGNGFDFAGGNFATGLTETPVFNLAGLYLGFNYSAFGISVGPNVVFNAGDSATVDVTLTEMNDPGATIIFDPSAIPPNDVISDDGLGMAPTPTPEASTFVSLGLPLLGLIGLAVRTRRRNRPAV